MVINDSAVLELDLMAVSCFPILSPLKPNWWIISSVLSVAVNYVTINVSVVHFLFSFERLHMHSLDCVLYQ